MPVNLMPELSRFRALLAAVAAAVLLLPLAPHASGAGPCPAGTPSKDTKGDARVGSFDDVEIAITWFRPGGVCAQSPVPVILAGHGWSGSRMNSFGNGIIGDLTVRDLLKHGYGVVSIDARGHGESGGQAFLHHPDQGVADYRAVLDWIHDELDWVRREGPAWEKDIVAGGAGGSYGGGWQLMTAAFDDRLDAIIPVVTWNSLVSSLAPNGVVRTAWISLLYAAGKAYVDVDPRIDQWFLQTMATNVPPAAAVEALSEASPAMWMGNIDIPTLLIQGMPDTLFPLNEAAANYAGIRKNGAPVWLLGVNTGHVLPGLQPAGVGEVPSRVRQDDCGDPGGLSIDFYDAFLKGIGSARDRMAQVPEVVLPTEQGDCVMGSSWPVPGRSRTMAWPALVSPHASGSYLVPLFTAEKRTFVAGIPRLRATVPAGLDDILFLSIVAQRGDEFHVVHDQVTPIRTGLADLDSTLRIDMAGIATTLEPGDQLFIRVDALNEQFAVNGSRHPGLTVLTDVTLRLPLASR